MSDVWRGNLLILQFVDKTEKFKGRKYFVFLMAKSNFFMLFFFIKRSDNISLLMIDLMMILMIYDLNQFLTSKLKT